MTGNHKDKFSLEADRHRDYLCKFATKLTGDKEDAEDLVQETYVRAYQHFDKYELGSNCRAWLFKIMKNLFLNFLKKKTKMDSRVVRFENNEYLLHHELNHNDHSMSDEAITAINKIKDEYRLVLILFHLENYSLNEISEFLNRPVGTVKSRLHRARIELRNMLIHKRKL